VIKSRRIKWVGHVKRIGEITNAYIDLQSKHMKERNYFKHLGSDVMILKLVKFVSMLNQVPYYEDVSLA